MTADGLARVMAERDAAVAALARLHAAASAMVREYEVAAPDWWPNAIGPLEEAVEATEGDAGGEVAPAGSEAPGSRESDEWARGGMVDQLARAARRRAANERRLYP